MGDCSCKYIFLKVLLEAAGIFPPPCLHDKLVIGIPLYEGQRECEAEADCGKNSVCQKQ